MMHMPMHAACAAGLAMVLRAGGQRGAARRALAGAVQSYSAGAGADPSGFSASSPP
jgi:hypothetical protein